jgi:hydrogenase nickel incorporation protein HypB
MKMKKTVPIVENILSANDKVAAENRARLDGAGVFGINLMASPGAGKTSLILAALDALKGRVRLGVIEGDIASSIDADKAAAAGIPAVQINTGGECHLDAVMVRGALDKLPLDRIDLLIVENVGNLVCPAAFQLGTHLNILVASIPEGDDKPYKYPGMYRGVQALVINKTDLLPYVPFNMDYFRRGVEALNPGLASFPLSCRTGEGLPVFADWIAAQVKHGSQKNPH